MGQNTWHPWLPPPPPGAERLLEKSGHHYFCVHRQKTPTPTQLSEHSTSAGGDVEGPSGRRGCWAGVTPTERGEPVGSGDGSWRGKVSGRLDSASSAAKRPSRPACGSEASVRTSVGRPLLHLLPAETPAACPGTSRLAEGGRRAE